MYGVYYYSCVCYIVEHMGAEHVIRRESRDRHPPTNELAVGLAFHETQPLH